MFRYLQYLHTMVRTQAPGDTETAASCCRKSPPLSFHFLPQFKIRNDKLNIAKISVTKLSKIVDPQSKLRKAVLINNTLKHLQKHSDLWHIAAAEPGAGGGGGEEDEEEEVDITDTEDEELQTTEMVKTLVSKREEEKTSGSLSDDMLTLYDDIVNDIFGSSEAEHSADLQSHKETEQEKENVIDNYKETYLWSPYSYNSFLSELYTVSNNEKLQT